MATLESIDEKLRIAAESLDLAASEIRDLPLDPVRKYIRNIGEALGEIFEIQHQIYEQRPDLRPEILDEEPPEPDPDLDDAQKSIVAKLSQHELNEIDRLLLSCAADNWRKVAMLVGLAMSDDQLSEKGIPDIFFSQRIRKLIEAGHLESDGNLQYMRYSEVRLPGEKA